MIIKRTWDIDDIRSVLCHPEIYPCIAGDGCPEAKDFILPLQGNEYYGGYVNDEIISVMIYHASKDRQYCHIQVLPKYRKEYAREFAKGTLNEQLKNGPIFAEIPECYPNVLRFALGVGFEVIETTDEPYIRDGKSCEIKVLRCENGIC